MTDKPKGKPKNTESYVPKRASCSSCILGCLVCVLAGVLTCNLLMFYPSLRDVGVMIWRTVFPAVVDSCESNIAADNKYRIQEMSRGLRGARNQRFQSTVDGGRTWDTFYYWTPSSDSKSAECGSIMHVSHETYYFTFPPEARYLSTIITTTDAGQTWHIWDYWSHRDSLPEGYYCAELFDIQFTDALNGTFQQQCRNGGNTLFYEYITNDGGITWNIAND